MELVDAAYPLLMGVVASTDAEEACKGVDVAVMVGGFPRKVGPAGRDLPSLGLGWPWLCCAVL